MFLVFRAKIRQKLDEIFKLLEDGPERQEMQTTKKPDLRSDGSISPTYYDGDYWKAVTPADTLDGCVIRAKMLYKDHGPFSRYLELGCGMGFNLLGFLLSPELGVRTMQGIDVSAYALQLAPEAVKPYLLLRDVSDLSQLNDNSFDIIYSRNLLERLTHNQIRKCLQECKRIALKSVHIVDIGYNTDMPFGIPPRDGDQSRITMRSVGWWNQIFLTTFRPEEGWRVSVISRSGEAEFRCVKSIG